jgi:hypothetical protein
MSVDDDECSGWRLTGTTTKNVAKVREAIMEDWRWMIHNVCDIVKLSWNVVANFVTWARHERIPAKFMPKMLSKDQKEHRFAICYEFKKETARPLPLCFFPFLKMKFKLKGWHFESIEEILAASQNVMKMLMQNYFHQCFQSRKGDGGE